MKILGKPKINRSGFTLVEILIVVAVLAILTGFLGLNLVNQTDRSQLVSSRAIVIQALQEAQANSLANLADLSWGVHLEPNKLVVFADSGSGYAGAETQNKRTLVLPKLVRLSTNPAASEILFDKGRGTLGDGLEIILTESGLTQKVTVNSEGMIE